MNPQGEGRGTWHDASALRDGTGEGERITLGMPAHDGKTGAAASARSLPAPAASVRTEPPWPADREGPDRLGVERYRWVYGWKRVMDVLVSLVVGIIGLPLFAVIAWAIRLESPGSPIYWQVRYGKHGRRFTCYKFRSMHPDADTWLTTMLAADPRLRDEYARYRKLRPDPRVSRVGWILRRFSLDELPQLWNVLIGDMSIVGPRPYDVTELSLSCESQRVILTVRPGLTGLWQISGRNTKTFAERLVLDGAYVREWSPWLELKDPPSDTARSALRAWGVLACRRGEDSAARPWRSVSWPSSFWAAPSPGPARSVPSDERPRRRRPRLSLRRIVCSTRVGSTRPKLDSARSWQRIRGACRHARVSSGRTSRMGPGRRRRQRRTSARAIAGRGLRKQWIAVVMGVPGRRAAALAAARALVRERPVDVEVDVILARVLSAREDGLRDAVDTYRDALRLSPGDTAIRIQLAQTLVSSARYAEAIASTARWARARLTPRWKRTWLARLFRRVATPRP